MATVNYNGHTVTDQEVKNVLQAICDFFEADVDVTSGDRKTVPTGGSNTSAHLDGRAADFHVSGYDDGTAYLYLKVFAAAIFAGGNSYQIIWHGGLNPEIKAHLHIGKYAKTSDLWGYALFQQEGTKQSNIGITKMTTDIKLPLIAVPSR
jgi:hypothetical protein